MKIRQEKGSEVVEMTFVLPVIMVIIVTMMFFGLMMYEQVSAQSVLDDVLSRAAANWQNADEGIYSSQSGYSGFTVWDLYSRLIDVKDGKKMQNIRAAVLERLNKVCIITDKFTENDITLEGKNYVVYKSLSLSVNREFPLPLAGFLKMLGIPTSLRYKRTATAVIEDAPEFIRTIDMASDLLMKNSTIRNAYENINGKLGQLTQWFRDLQLN